MARNDTSGLYCSHACANNHHFLRPLSERFSEKVNRDGPCWLWTGSTNHFGHGKILRDHETGQFVQAHRYAFELAHGPIPDGMLVLHTCDTPGCCRNDDEGWYEVNGVTRPRRGHLFLGTHEDNMADMAAKGRSAHAKVTRETADEIRQDYASGHTNLTQLGTRYGVHRATIARIIRGERWGATKTP